MDYIFLNALKVHRAVGLSPFLKEGDFPITVSCSVYVPATSSDEYSLSYGTLARAIQSLTERYSCIDAFTDAILQLPVFKNVKSIEVSKSGGLLRVKKETYRVDNNVKEWSVSGITVPCVIGVYDYERVVKQDVHVTASVTDPHHEEEKRKETMKLILTTIENSSFGTVEALAQQVADLTLSHLAGSSVRVSVSKPSAITFATDSGVCITRTR